MNTVNSKERYRLNPYYVLRHDGKRSVIYSQEMLSVELAGKVPHSADWYSIIHPVQAMILSLIHKPKPLTDFISELTDFSGLPETDAIALIEPYISNQEPFHTEYEGHKFSFPANVIVPDRDYPVIREYSPHEFIYSGLDFTTKRRIKSPDNITLMLNNKCATECIYCYADIRIRRNCTIPFERIQELVKEAFDLKIMNFGVLGGEFFLYPYWYELLCEMKKYHFYPNLISTKVPLREQQILKLKEILTGYTGLQISVDSAEEDILCSMLAVKPDYLANMTAMLDMLNKYEINIKIATILTNKNCSPAQLGKMARLLSRYKNVIMWDIRSAFDSLYIDNTYFQTIKCTRPEILNAYDYIQKNRNDYPFKVNFDNTNLNKKYYSAKDGSANFEGAQCSANRTHMFILPDGKVTICEQLYWNERFIVGDVIKQSIEEVWNSPRSLYFAGLKPSDVRKESACHSFGIFDKCHSAMNKCWVDIMKAYGADNWDYPDPRCDKAPEMFNELLYK